MKESAHRSSATARTFAKAAPRALVEAAPGALAEVEPSGGRIGRLVAIGTRGEPLVDFPGNHLGPLAARSVVALPVDPDTVAGGSIEVLLAFDGGDPARPIIAGILLDHPWDPAFRAALPAEGAAARDVTVNGRRIVLEGREEISLRCGKASVTIRANGEVVVKGARISSRATGTQTIKGAAVRIN